MHLSNAHFVLRDISALLDPSWGVVIAHFQSLSVEAIERRRGKEGMGGRSEAVKAKILANNKVHI